jgi:hypothetical protein
MRLSRWVFMNKGHFGNLFDENGWKVSASGSDCFAIAKAFAAAPSRALQNVAEEDVALRGQNRFWMELQAGLELVAI